MTDPQDDREARTILILLYLGYLLSYADRVIFGMALEPIKRTLALSDSQLGLLSGVAFAASYAIFSPIGGLLVDRFRRKIVMAGAITFWSVATFATALTTSFLGMGLARAGVGVGESVLHPLAVSLVGDTVPRERRSGAFAVYMSAGATGSLLAQLLGGLLILFLMSRTAVVLPGIGATAPWQGLFIAAALLGIILAGVVLGFLREPRREPVPATLEIGSHSGISFIRSNPRFSLAIFAGIATVQMGAYTLATWNIPYFERVYAWTGAEAAIWVAATGGISTLVGCLLSGRMIEALRRRGQPDAPLIIAFLGAICFSGFGTLALLMPDAWMTIALLPLASFWSYVPAVAGFTAIGETLPAPIRARLAGLLTLSIGIITNSLGPFLVGTFSDNLFPDKGGLRWALIVTLLIAGLVGTALIAQGRRGYRTLMAAAR